ncbi:hypothetical protein [Telmatospirillum sp.]|uniref:hypothetical protein n=1 Tax=Telmatospirillum sp. TaxID=2079197 RepID=UPI00284601A8|nr:hypothetical protein [Telmatospirillum sp.]MDR3436244.1 hypothetical protein [Telmatospirillum sp.]
MSFPKISTIDHTMDDFLQAIHQRSKSNTPASEMLELQKLIRTMWNLLTPEQSLRLANDRQIKALFHKGSQSETSGGYQGTLGGFGTEELEEWQRTAHQPTP